MRDPPVQVSSILGYNAGSRVAEGQITVNDKRALTETGMVVLMGVSGSGKSTIGGLLAKRLGWEFQDADWFHPPENVEKMHAGVPLTDEDRWPWLRAIARWMDEAHSTGVHAVIACSALKRRYRDILLQGRPYARLVYLKGEEALIARRLATRHEHFMPAALLKSQFNALEEPGADENPIVVSIEPAPQEIVDMITGALS
jgi:carbohydrate kinase (thermoresistant glucokinase family)